MVYQGCRRGIRFLCWLGISIICYAYSNASLSAPYSFSSSQNCFTIKDPQLAFRGTSAPDPSLKRQPLVLVYEQIARRMILLQVDENFATRSYYFKSWSLCDYWRFPLCEYLVQGFSRQSASSSINTLTSSSNLFCRFCLQFAFLASSYIINL